MKRVLVVFMSSVLLVFGLTAAKGGCDKAAKPGPTHRVKMITNNPPVWLGGRWVFKGPAESGEGIWIWHPEG